jgi:hypothetical protein
MSERGPGGTVGLSSRRVSWMVLGMEASSEAGLGRWKEGAFTSESRVRSGIALEGERRDSNPRPPGPQPGARYRPSAASDHTSQPGAARGSAPGSGQTDVAAKHRWAVSLEDPPSATGRRNVGLAPTCHAGPQAPPRDVHWQSDASARFHITAGMSRGLSSAWLRVARSSAGLRARKPRWIFPPATRIPRRRSSSTVCEPASPTESKSHSALDPMSTARLACRAGGCGSTCTKAARASTAIAQGRVEPVYTKSG